MHYSNHPVTKEYRQILRRTTTPTENMLWRRLKGKQLDGLRFRQQHGYGPYVLERTEFLLEQRIHVLRFRNEDVENDVEGVLERIREYINRVIINKTEAVQTPVAHLT